MATHVWDVLHVAPPLVATYDEIDRTVTGIDESLTIAEGDYANELSD